MMKVINFFSGPGCGKSRTATALFSALKQKGVNVEYVPEFAKDAAWEGRSTKFFEAQQYIYGEQSWRLQRLVGDVDIAITDSPLPLSICYYNEKLQIPSLSKVILEDFNRYNNYNVHLMRGIPYNPKGRYQTEQQAVEVDCDVVKMLEENKIKIDWKSSPRYSDSLVDDLIDDLSSSRYNWI